MVAVAIALEYTAKAIPGLQMPAGGTFSLTCLPLIIGALYTGPIYGVLGGVLYGLLNFFIDGYGLHWGSLFLDYLLAFGFMGVAGFFAKPFYKKKWWAFVLACICAMVLRYLSSSLSGVLFFPPDDGTDKYLYSFVLYNAPYMSASLGMDLVVGLLLLPALFSINDEYALKPLRMQVGLRPTSHLELFLKAKENNDLQEMQKQLSFLIEENDLSLTQALELLEKKKKN